MLELHVICTAHYFCCNHQFRLNFHCSFTYQTNSVLIISPRFNFNKVAQYKQFTLEEAEEKMNSRKKAQHGYERWMMKAATNGAVAFSEVDKFGGKDSKNTSGDDDDEGNFSDKGDEDEEEEGARKNRRRPKKRGGDDEGASGDDDLDDEADDSEKGKHFSCPCLDCYITRYNHSIV